MNLLIVELIGGPADGETLRVPFMASEPRPGSVFIARQAVYQLSSVPNVLLAHHIGSQADYLHA